MKIILLLLLNILILGNCIAQNPRKYRTRPYSVKKKWYISPKVGTTLSQINYKTKSSGFSSLEIYGGISFEKYLAYNKILEIDLLFSHLGSSHFVEIPLIFKQFLNRETNLFIGIAPNIQLDALSDNTNDINISKNVDLYSDLKAFRLSGLLGGQYFYSKNWFMEVYYSKGFIPQFEIEESDLFNGIRNTFRVGVGYII